MPATNTATESALTATGDPAYRITHSPPGMTVFRPPATRMPAQKWLAEVGDTGRGPDGAYDTADEARAAAWVWYDKALLAAGGVA